MSARRCAVADLRPSHGAACAGQTWRQVLVQWTQSAPLCARGRRSPPGQVEAQDASHAFESRYWSESRNLAVALLRKLEGRGSEEGSGGRFEETRPLAGQAQGGLGRPSRL